MKIEIFMNMTYWNISITYIESDMSHELLVIIACIKPQFYNNNTLISFNILLELYFIKIFINIPGSILLT